jgi:Mg2+ and Co2+ transporter CorA
LDADLWKRLLVASTAKERASDSKKVTFAELHNVAKHITHLREAVESCLLLTESLIQRTKESSWSQGQLYTQPATGGQTVQELRDLLLYRQSLFRSTKLRLESLNQRVSNSIALSFNLLTVSDSNVLIQHSSVMKIMAAITIIFLPTTAVAAIMGSDLFESSFENESWTVRPTPLFMWLWAVAVPLTFVVLFCAAVWHWKTHKVDEKNKGLVRRITGL